MCYKSVPGRFSRQCATYVCRPRSGAVGGRRTIDRSVYTGSCVAARVSTSAPS